AADRPGRHPCRAHLRRVRDAGRLCRAPAPGPLARPAPRPDARPRLLAVRPQRRRPGEPAPAQDRARPEGALADRHGAERRLRLHAQRRFEMRRFVPDSLPAWALLTLIVGLVVTQVSTLTVVANGRETRQKMMEFFRLAERVSSITRAVASAPGNQRQGLAAA